jgi:hypothetical protein
MGQHHNEIHQAAMHRQRIRNQQEPGTQAGGRCRFGWTRPSSHARTPHLTSPHRPTGAFATVYRGKERSTGRIWAVKEISKQNLRGDDLANLEVRARRPTLQRAGRSLTNFRLRSLTSDALPLGTDPLSIELKSRPPRYHPLSGRIPPQPVARRIPRHP